MRQLVVDVVSNRICTRLFTVRQTEWFGSYCSSSFLITRVKRRQGHQSLTKSAGPLDLLKLGGQEIAAQHPY